MTTTRITIRALLLAFSLAPRVAQAGKSACMPPQQAVPTSTQTAIDAALEARVASVGTGSASTSAASATENATVLLSQDDAAKAWYLYHLCAQAERKLISPIAYEEERRFVLGMESYRTRATIATPATEPTASGAVEADLAGAWTATITPIGSDCPAPNDGPNLPVYRYTWTIAVTSTGGSAVPGITVNAAMADGSATTYPIYTGFIKGDRFEATAPPNAGYAGRSLLEGTVQPDGSLRGVRVFSALTGTAYWKGGNSPPCLAIWDLEARRQ